MKKTLFFLSILCVLFASCKQKPVKTELQWWNPATSPSYHRIFFQIGTITKVTVVFLERLPSGKDTIVAQTTKHIAVPSTTQAYVKLSDSSSLKINIPIKVIAYVAVDVNGDGMPDKIMKLEYLGQKIGDRLDANCGNSIKLSGSQSRYSNEWKGNGGSSATGGTGKQYAF